MTLHVCVYDYALIVSISTPDQDVDIYTPIANQIGIPVEVIV